MKAKQLFLILILLKVAQVAAFSQVAGLKSSPIKGSWVEEVNRLDTLVFSPEFDGQNPVFNLKRGFRITEEGFRLPDYFSGPYNYHLEQDHISVIWFLSSGAIQTFHFSMAEGNDRFSIGNFFKDPEGKKNERDTLEFIRIK